MDFCAWKAPGNLLIAKVFMSLIITVMLNMPAMAQQIEPLNPRKLKLPPRIQSLPAPGKQLSIPGRVLLEQNTLPQASGADDLVTYLVKMRKLISEFDSVAGPLLMESTGLTTDPQRIEGGANRLVAASQQINSLVPPRELSTAHKDIANLFSSVSSYCTGNTQASPDMLLTASMLIGQVGPTMSTYRARVRNVIAAHHLSQQLDPFSCENEANKAHVLKNLDQYKADKFNALQSGTSSSNSGEGCNDMSSLTNLFGGQANGGGQALLNNLLKQSGSPNTGGNELLSPQMLEQLKKMMEGTQDQ